MGVGDSQTGEQWYQRSSHTAVKILSPTSGFPGWGSRKGTGNPQETWPWRPAGFDDRTSTRLRETETSLYKGTNKTCVHQDSQKGAVPPLETEPDLPANVVGSPVEAWLPKGWGHWRQESWKVSFGVSPLGGHLYPYHRASRLHGCITSGQQVGGKPLPLAGNWIKASLSTALPIRGRPSFPHSQSFPSGNLHLSL